jgi:hypothetical protein
MTVYFGSFLILQGRLKEGNKGFHALRGFIKVTINYPRHTRKLKGRQLQQSIT